MKKLLSLLLAVCLCFSVCGCTFLGDVADMTATEEAKTFDFDEVSMELTTKFLRMDFISEDYNFIVGNEIITIMGLKVEGKDTDLAELNISEFAEHFSGLLSVENIGDIVKIGDVPTTTYTLSAEGGQTVLVAYYKNGNDFWVITFTTLTENYEDSYDDICKFVKSVKFN